MKGDLGNVHSVCQLAAVSLREQFIHPARDRLAADEKRRYCKIHQRRLLL